MYTVLARIDLRTGDLQIAADRMSAVEQLERVLAVLRPVLDIVSSPVEEAAAPGWCERRGWSEFLLSLTRDELEDCEANGLESRVLELGRAPDGFRRLFADVRRLTRLPLLASSPLSVPAEALRGVPERKREQLRTLLGVLAPSAARATRIVDVGAGSGHFSRLSAELFQRRTVALDRNAALVRNGLDRSQQRSREVGALAVDFVTADLAREPLALRSTDLAVGLHACGELGDQLALAAALAGCELSLVSCCLQKIQGSERVALSRAASGFRLRKADLGLTNLTLRREGVEASLRENLRAREARLAVRRLLRARGVDVRPGEEMRGVNRRRAHAGFRELASRVLASRALPPATDAELTLHEESARSEHLSMRRFSLPRHLLSRLVELAVVFDRAALLEERGSAVQVAQLFEDAITPRNTLLLAERRR
jgi:SAM-dependent methyltransferase